MSQQPPSPPSRETPPQAPYPPQQPHPQQPQQQSYPPQQPHPQQPPYPQQGYPQQPYPQQPPPPGQPRSAYTVTGPQMSKPKGGNSAPVWLIACAASGWFFAVVLGMVLVAKSPSDATAPTAGTQGNGAVAPQVQPTAPPAVPSGPAFDDMDDRMNDQVTTLTEAQKTAYWNSIRGTQIRWTGTLENASTDHGSMMYVQCSRRSNSADVAVDMADDQVGRLGQLSKGQRVTFTGTIDTCGDIYYNVTNGRIE